MLCHFSISLLFLKVLSVALKYYSWVETKSSKSLKTLWHSPTPLPLLCDYLCTEKRSSFGIPDCNTLFISFLSLVYLSRFYSNGRQKIGVLPCTSKYYLLFVWQYKTKTKLWCVHFPISIQRREIMCKYKLTSYCSVKLMTSHLLNQKKPSRVPSLKLKLGLVSSLEETPHMLP